MKIKALLADGLEEIEAITIIDMLRRAGYTLETVSIMGTREILGAHEVKIVADSIFSQVNFDDTDLLFLPGGGPGVLNLSADERVIDLVKKFHSMGKYIAAICAAPFILEKADILRGKEITCYPSWKDKIDSPDSILDQDVVFDGKIITARGVGAAIDMGLKLVELFSSKEKSEELRKEIVYKI